MDEERLKMLRWQHLKVELDDRAKEWPENSSYEFDQKKQVVTWHFAGQNQGPGRLVWHLTSEELSAASPSDVAGLIIKQANRVAKGND